ncbi:MAG: hypothetical protein ABSF03_28005 [Streptosporangiaceae bacterium]
MKPPCPRLPHHKQIGAVAGIEQDLSGDALSDLGAYPDLTGRVEGAGDRLGDGLRGSLLKVEVLSRSRIHPPEPAIHNRIAPCVTASTAAPVSPACRIAQRRALMDEGDPSTPASHIMGKPDPGWVRVPA